MRICMWGLEVRRTAVPETTVYKYTDPRLKEHYVSGNPKCPDGPRILTEAQTRLMK